MKIKINKVKHACAHQQTKNKQQNREEHMKGKKGKKFPLPETFKCSLLK